MSTRVMLAEQQWLSATMENPLVARSAGHGDCPADGDLSAWPFASLWLRVKMKQDWQRLPGCPGPDLTSVTDKYDESRGFKVKILNKNPTCMTIIYCLGFSNLRSVPLGIVDNAVVLERSRLLVKCWLINWLVGWLDVRFRCGLYLSISSS